jgi:hypothetical protein
MTKVTDVIRAAALTNAKHTPRREPVGRKPRTSQPTSRGRQKVRERSLYDRYPRSLAALETTRRLSRIKQVGSSIGDLHTLHTFSFQYP